jgi:hypothetical protein
LRSENFFTTKTITMKDNQNGKPNPQKSGIGPVQKPGDNGHKKESHIKTPPVKKGEPDKGVKHADEMDEEGREEEMENEKNSERVDRDSPAEKNENKAGKPTTKRVNL